MLGVPLADLRRDHPSVKWRAYPSAVLPVWVAEMDAVPCAPIVAAVTAALQRGDLGYAWGPPLSQAFATYAHDTWSWDVALSDTDSSTVVTDVMIGVSELLRLLTDEGGPVIVNTPCYDSFHGFLDAIRRRPLHAPLTESGRIDLDKLSDAFRAATARGERAAYLLCSPHNPTGTVHTREELDQVAARADEYGVRVVADEIHAPILLEGSFVPWLTVPGSESGYAVHSASKAWNLAALKCAVVVPGRRAHERLHEVHTHGASHLGAIAHTAAYTDGRPWLAQLLRELDANRHLVAGLIADHAPGVVYRMPQATYLAWLDFRALDLGEDPAAFFRRRGKVALSSGPDYGPEGRGFARLNLASSPDILREAFTRIASCLD
ncbi:MAG: aminotransferase class I/II-fold pyridoxal phosphate-dependent enzyme [Micrococcales bacterium]|nr:aminotransferase class I/II-fold pyridoxal phosphate-dependent enzyme [Micrococcales bacterium]